MHEFIELVHKMRAAQKAYFKFQNRSDLIEAKKLEAEVDRALQTLRAFERDQEQIAHDEKQQDLFK